jgi:hypothetical protein
MKRFLLLFLLPALACAADVKLAWDAGDWPSDTIVRIYETTSATPVMVAESAPMATQVTIPNVTPGVHKYIARAYSPTWKIESADSNEVATPPVPSVPANLRYSITITIGN